MLCSKLHRHNSFNLIFFSYTMVYPGEGATMAPFGGCSVPPASCTIRCSRRFAFVVKFCDALGVQGVAGNKPHAGKA